MPRPLPKKETIHVPEPAVAAAAPEKNVAAEANKNIASAKTGFDPLRPVKLTAKFIGGTLVEGMNGMARYGRKGLAVGIGLGIVAAIATTGGIAMFLQVALISLAVGMVGGGLVGALTGGMHAVGRDHRAKKYADDLLQRKNVQDNATPNLQDYRSAYRQQQMTNSYKNQQLIARVGENTRDFNTYWQDREAGRRERLPQEKGLGF